MSDNIFSSWPDIWTSVNKFSHFINILISYCLRNCQIQCNLLGDSQLVELEIWIWTNDSSCREINSLSHKITSETTFFTSESGTDSFQWFARFVFLSWLTLNFVVHDSRNIVLEIGSQLIDCGLVSTSVDLVLQSYIGL